MGVLTDIIVADRGEAQAISDARGAHGRSWPVLESKGIDPVKLEGLWSVLPGGNRDPTFMGKDSLVHQAGNHGPWIMLVPPQLVPALAEINSDEELDRIAAAWADTESCRAEGWSTEGVREYLVELVALARNARDANKDLLLWTCL